MPFGTEQKIIICSPSPEVTTDLCGVGFSPAVTNAFVLSPNSSAFFTDFDAALSASYFAASFGLIIGFYALSRLLNYLLSTVR